MDGKMLARLGAVVFVAMAITATVIEMTRKDDPAPASTAPALQPPAAPLRCLSAWAESRDRFLGRTPAQTAPRQNEEQ